MASPSLQPKVIRQLPLTLMANRPLSRAMGMSSNALQLTFQIAPCLYNPCDRLLSVMPIWHSRTPLASALAFASTAPVFGLSGEVAMGLLVMVIGLVLFLGPHVFVTMRPQRDAASSSWANGRTRGCSRS